MLPRSLSTKNRKRLLRDVLYTFDTHTGCVYDVTATSSWAQNGSPSGPAFVPFKLFLFYFIFIIIIFLQMKTK